MLKRLTRKEALIEVREGARDPRNALVRDPLRGLIPADVQFHSDGLWKIVAPQHVVTDFPQLEVSGSRNWSVWPNWRLCLEADDMDHMSGVDEPLAWQSTGLISKSVDEFEGVTLEWPPNLIGAEEIAETALRVLTSTFGNLPWARLRLLIEVQEKDFGSPKGIAVPYPSGMWCRVQSRPGDIGSTNDRLAVIELILHELLHHIVEFDTPAGHVLTEGLITYLARLMIVRARLATVRWFTHVSNRVERELRQWHLEGMTLSLASRRFFRSQSARRTAYRKGFLVIRDLDEATLSRLLEITINLVVKRTRVRLPLTEPTFVAAMPPKAQKIYQANCR